MRVETKRKLLEIKHDVAVARNLEKRYGRGLPYQVKSSRKGIRGSAASLEGKVLERYALGAKKKEGSLCCPVDYVHRYLEVIPKEILEKDYGCGDPSRFIKEGEIVLDLGSGGGKICYIASQVVGPKGRVIGVDFNPPMLELARKYQDEVGEKIGWKNVEFRYGKIQDLKTDFDSVEKKLRAQSMDSLDDYLKFQNEVKLESCENPLIASDSMDAIISNCVLNLVEKGEKKQLFSE